MATDIPIIDLDRPIETIAAQIAAACRGTGFFYIENHGVPARIVEAAFAANRAFHARPPAEKLAIKMNKWHRGYQPLAASTLKSSDRFAPAKHPNQLECFFLRHEVGPGHPDFGSDKPLQGPNQWPDDADFRAAVTAYDDAVRALGLRLLRPFGIAAGETADFFTRFFAPPSTCLRLVHYPPAAPLQPEDLYGIQPHTDYGCLTILAQDDVGGLQIRRVDGTWIDAPYRPGSFVVNIGDAMARWSNGVFNSTPHRVVSPGGRDRLSIAYFFDPNLDAEVRCLPAFCRDTPPKHPPMRYGDYFAMRLDANYPDRTGMPAATV